MSKIDIPLEFWFCKQPKNSSILGQKILEHYDVLAMAECKKADVATSYDETAKILDNLHKLENECVFKYLSRKDSGLALPMIHPKPQPLFEYIKYVQELLNKFTPN